MLKLVLVLITAKSDDVETFELENVARLKFRNRNFSIGNELLKYRVSVKKKVPI